MATLLSMNAPSLDTGRNVNLPPHRRRLGYIFQEGRLFTHLTVRQNLRYGQWFAPKNAPHERMDHVVEMLGLGHLLDRRPQLLSGGEKQRVAIGRALLASPKIILADEPLAALDEARKAEIIPYFERLRDEISDPIVYVSHSASEVARLATTVVALEAGRVIRQGNAADVLGDPAVSAARRTRRRCNAGGTRCRSSRRRAERTECRRGDPVRAHGFRRAGQNCSRTHCCP